MRMRLRMRMTREHVELSDCILPLMNAPRCSARHGTAPHRRVDVRRLSALFRDASKMAVAAAAAMPLTCSPSVSHVHQSRRDKGRTRGVSGALGALGALGVCGRRGRSVRAAAVVEGATGRGRSGMETSTATPAGGSMLLPLRPRRCWAPRTGKSFRDVCTVVDIPLSAFEQEPPAGCVTIAVGVAGVRSTPNFPLHMRMPAIIDHMLTF